MSETIKEEPNFHRSEDLSDITHSLHEVFSKIFPSENADDSDPYFKTIIAPGGYLRIADILQAPPVLKVTTDQEVIRSAVFSYKGFAVHEGMIKPKGKQEQNTLILRDIPSSFTPDEIIKIFAEIQNPPSPLPTSVRSELNNTWFVSFASEDEAKTSLSCIKSVALGGKPIKARLKTESASRSFYGESPNRSLPALEVNNNMAIPQHLHSPNFTPENASMFYPQFAPPSPQWGMGGIQYPPQYPYMDMYGMSGNMPMVFPHPFYDPYSPNHYGGYGRGAPNQRGRQNRNSNRGLYSKSRDQQSPRYQKNGNVNQYPQANANPSSFDGGSIDGNNINEPSTQPESTTEVNLDETNIVVEETIEIVQVELPSERVKIEEIDISIVKIDVAAEAVSNKEQSGNMEGAEQHDVSPVEKVEETAEEIKSTNENTEKKEHYRNNHHNNSREGGGRERRNNNNNNRNNNNNGKDRRPRDNNRSRNDQERKEKPKPPQVKLNMEVDFPTLGDKSSSQPSNDSTPVVSSKPAPAFNYASMVRKPNNPTPQQASAAPAEKTPKPKEPEPSVPSQQQSKTPSPPPVSTVPAPAAAPAHTVSKPAVEAVTAPLPAAAAFNHAAPDIKASVPVVVEVIPAVVSPTAVPAASVPAVEKVDAPPPLSFGSFGEVHSADDQSKPTKKSFIDVVRQNK